MWSMASALMGLFAIVCASVVTPAVAQQPVRIESRFAQVNGVRLHYLIAGKGNPVFLLHGYAQNSHMWRPLMAELAKTNTVIAPDLRGFGQSEKAGAGLRQEDDGAGHPRACRRRSAIEQRAGGRTRHRSDGRLRLRGAVSRTRSSASR